MHFQREGRAYRGQWADDVLKLVLRPGCVGLSNLRHRDEEGRHPHQSHEAKHLASVQGAAVIIKRFCAFGRGEIFTISCLQGEQ